MEPSMFDDRAQPDNEHSFGGVWTLIKLEALVKYLVAFNLALSKQNFTRIYIDAFAGTGRCDITVDGAKISVDGSAKRALSVNPPFDKYYFIELKAKKLSASRRWWQFARKIHRCHSGRCQCRIEGALPEIPVAERTRRAVSRSIWNECRMVDAGGHREDQSDRCLVSVPILWPVSSGGEECRCDGFWQGGIDHTSPGYR